jgi:hypothetical protein
MTIPEKLKPEWSAWMTVRMFHAAKDVIESVQEPSDPPARAKFHELAKVVREFQEVFDKDISTLFAGMKENTPCPR